MIPRRVIIRPILYEKPRFTPGGTFSTKSAFPKTEFDQWETPVTRAQDMLGTGIYTVTAAGTVLCEGSGVD